MNLIKVALGVLGFVAAYQAANVLVFGRPVDTEKALTEWEANVKSELPKNISATATLTDVSLLYHKPYGVALLYEPELRKWDEIYTVALENPESIDREKKKLVDYICRSELHKKLLDLEVEINLVLRAKQSLRPPDFSVARSLVQTPSWEQYFEKRTTVSKASCI